MAALVQGYPRQTGTVTMLQTRPTSASGIMTSQNHPSHQQYGHGLPQQRNSIHGLPSGAGAPVAYRGNSGPVQPYAFTATPSLNAVAQWQQFRTTYRTTSTPAVPAVQSFDYGQPPAGRPRYSASVSMTNLPSTAIIPSQTGGGSRDDSILPVSGSRRTAAGPRPQSAHITESFSQAGPLTTAGPTRVSPERYRRPAPRAPESAVSSLQSHGSVSPQPSSAGVPAGSMPSGSRGLLDQTSSMLRTPQTSLVNRPNSVAGPMSGSAVDDIELSRGPIQDGMQRTRRRSMPALDSAGFSKPLTPPALEQPEESSRLDQAAPRKIGDSENKAVKPNNNLAVNRGTAPAHARAGSSDSRSSSRSAGSSTRPTSSANRNANPTGNPAAQSSLHDQTGNSADYPRLVNIPPRSSSSDAASTKRVTNPSPLSKPASMDAEVGNRPSADAPANAPASPMKTSEARIESPAVRQLAALNQTGGKARSKTSRLRRAFSFGSAAEFRKVVHDGDAREETDPTTPAKLHKERNADELYHAEQARIAQQQEEAGIGNNIYSGGKIFSGSTDNISISSTASSASIMIRKMGRGMKKGTRSLVGLFRPKSIIGAPAADSQLPEATQGSVSMVTVEAEREAERERVNVKSDVRSQPGGGTGFPHLERNSIDATDAIGASKTSTGSDRLDSSGTDTARKSIVGGERERAEVLAAVRKGILKKRSGSSSPSPHPSESKPPSAFDASSVPTLTDSPNSSAPSTPNEETQGHRRTGPVAIGNEDYFISALRLRQDTKSAPATPQGSMRRNATFSPRIAFYETWPSQEYDRRGDVATCNRLTPMLAQQIKEELNSFKMEMEVHENSKIYTHFF
ncbi:hypothetical protein B0T22DRAFT_436152 [Podospora appendiculata]|uniref:Protein BNI4 n=1 Tax=Podospora appendiculata TaxID=314037 RepID=A0AAE1CG32_9PEZI|nr:hypothetical protein B0T22DRAFT_436152 [Podospora appendiculata]